MKNLAEATNNFINEESLNYTAVAVQRGPLRTMTRRPCAHGHLFHCPVAPVPDASPMVKEPPARSQPWRRQTVSSPQQCGRVAPLLVRGLAGSLPHVHCPHVNNAAEGGFCFVISSFYIYIINKKPPSMQDENDLRACWSRISV